jgi:uncharacterized repeat protein (TIGR01451 family)
MKKHYKSSSDFDQGSMTVQRNAIAQISAIGIRVSRAAFVLPLVVTGMGIGYWPSSAQALTAGGSAGCPAGTRLGPDGPSPETSFIGNGTFSTNPTTTGLFSNSISPNFSSNLPYRGNGIYPDDEGRNNPTSGQGAEGSNPRGGLSVQSGNINYAGGIVLGVPLPADTPNGVVGSNTYLYSNPNQGYDANGTLSTNLFQNPIVWRQTVTGLQPNTTYNFSGYFLNLLNPDNADVQATDDVTSGVSPQITLGIDPVGGGASISASPIRVRRRVSGANSLNGWQRVQYSFTTGAGETQATLSIIDTANNVSGDDFGLTAIGLNECVPVPVINKSVSRFADNNNNGILDVGDDLRYTVTVRNPSPNPISNLVISDFQTPNLQLLPNTASVDQSFTATSTVQNGFTGSNTPVPFTNSGTLPGGQTVTLTYNTRILPGATSPIVNQASARFTGDGGTPILSDTRDTPTQDASGQNPGNVVANDPNGRINQPVGTATEPTIVNIGGAGISGTLYQDTTQNGTLDTNEARLPANITVRLLDSNGNVVQTTTTDANGQYRFTTLTNGSYTIQVDTNDTDIPSSLRLTSPQNNSIPVQFTGTAIADRNFGFNPSSISGTLYEDTAPQNNTLDPNETRLPAGITVRLIGSNGNVVQTTTTTANGQYFFNNVPNGNYRIQADSTNSNIPRGFGLGTPNDLQVNFSGTPVNNRNFGFRPSGISGTLYRDTSPQNNTLDPNETKLPANITVRLLNSNNTDVVPPVVTDANGQYIFTNVPNGNYRIQVDTNDSDIPAGSRLTSPNNLPVNFTGTPIINQNFGFIPSGISGTLFRDTSTTTPNGTLDPGETGLPPGITVRLLDANNNPVATTTTDPNGQFTFTEVPNGNYRIQVDPNDPNIPRGFNLTTPNNRQINFTGTPVTGQNFGFVPQGISGTLFQDTSPANGNLDPGETRLPAGITVRLLDPNGNVVRTTTTDANGQFAFTDIPAGTYSVDVDPNDPNIPPGSTLRNARRTPVTLAAGGTAIVPVPFTASASVVSSLRLVKRITTATRGGAPISGVSFDAVDPGDGASDITSAGGNPRGVRDIPVATASLQSGDEVEYTIYYINTGAQTANRVNFCDLIPTGTTFVSNSSQLQVANDQARQAGRFFGRLAPLPQGNPCTDSNNPNGAVIVDLGNVPGGQGRNYGLVRFRVRIN